MKYGKIVTTDITYNPADDYTEVEEIAGGLDARGVDTRKAFPKLKTIGGGLNVRGADTKTTFPKLKTIGGLLDVQGADTKTAFPKLTAICGWLDAQGADTRTAFPKLTVIGGGLDARGVDTRKAFPKLTTIGEWLFICDAKTRTAFPKLTTIGGGLNVRGANTKTTFPKLTTVGGWLDVQGANTKTTFPKLKTIGGLLDVQGADTKTAFPELKHENTNKAKQITRKKLKSVLLKSGYMWQDEILSKHLGSRKLANGLIVHTGIIVGKTDKIYVIETPNGVYAHGNTVKQAREALLYKLSENRDTTPYKAWTLDTSITKRQAIQSYMAITGACATGTQHLVETRFGDKVPARTTVRQVIALTVGQYGNGPYKNFFAKNNGGTK